VRPPDCGHSLGRIVVREAEGGVRPPLVIDGQQRLTSLLLLLASLRDVFRSLTRVENDSEQYRHDEQARGAANELVQKCNASLFPWGGQGSIPALDDLVGGSNQHQLLGKIVRSAALVPTYLDRDAYWEATHPESPLCGPDPGVPMDSTETLASGAELDGAIWGHDRIRSAKRTITAYLEDEALPKAISKTAVASAHWLGQSSLGCLVLAGKAILRSVLHSCYVLYFSVREEDVWSIYERLAFREAALRSLIDSKSPGVSMAECDLARNLLLSYFRIEEAQLEAFRALWAPVEARAQAAAAAEEAERPAGLSHRWERGGGGGGETTAMLGRLMQRLVAARQRPREASAPGGEVGCAGGAAHLLSAHRLFPTYGALRAVVEAELRRAAETPAAASAGADPARRGEAAARSVLEGLSELSRDPASFAHVGGTAAGLGFGGSASAPRRRLPGAPHGSAQLPSVMDGPGEPES